MKRILLFSLLFFLCCVFATAQNLKPFVANNGLYGYKDEKDKVVIAPQYVTATYFFKGVDKAWVYLNDKFALIDKTGKQVIPFKYSYVNYFQEGMEIGRAHV